MRTLAFFAALLLSSSLFANALAIFSKSEAYDLNSPTPSLKEADKAAFVGAAKSAFADGASFEGRLPLVNPPEWGKTVSAQTQGEVNFRTSFAGGFICHLTLDNLAPNHRYILTINGNPTRQGNDRLLDPVPGLLDERFYDFLFITTDAKGKYEGSLAVALKTGPYDVRLYVKDTADFKIVLYRDFFKFEVK